MRDAIVAIDTRILEAALAARDPVLVHGFSWIAELGRLWFIFGLAACAVLVLTLIRRYALAAGLSISVGTAGIFTLLIKGIVERERPPIEFQAYIEAWHSFPSAHAALSVSLYGFLALLALQLASKIAWRYIAASVLLALIVGISFSRVYLGVHFPSDVIAGILLGAICVWIGWKYATIASNERS